MSTLDASVPPSSPSSEPLPRFGVSPAEESFRQDVRALAQRELAPRAATADRDGVFPPENLRALAEHGLLALGVPREYGGQAASTLQYALAMEELAAACASTAVLVSVHNSLVADPIHHWGTPEQCGRYLPAMARGETIGAFALTEPTAGSDAASLRTRAVRDGSGYRLNGNKVFITNSGLAGLYLVFTTLDPSAGARGITAFLVERDAPGLVIGPLEHKLGIRASATAQLYFEECRVSAEQRLGEEGHGWRVAMSTLDGGRVGIAAQALGIGRAAYEAALGRVAADPQVAGEQGRGWLLADMYVRLEAARLLVHRAAVLKDQGQRPTREAAAAKVYAAETAMWVAAQAMQLGGEAACSLESPFQRYLRDAKITEIYEGTSEIQRLILAEQLLRDAGPLPERRTSGDHV
jgi:butyryl-CoA dehydrogenase